MIMLANRKHYAKAFNRVPTFKSMSIGRTIRPQRQCSLCIPNLTGPMSTTSLFTTSVQQISKIPRSLTESCRPTNGFLPCTCTVRCTVFARAVMLGSNTSAYSPAAMVRKSRSPSTFPNQNILSRKRLATGPPFAKSSTTTSNSSTQSPWHLGNKRLERRANNESRKRSSRGSTKNKEHVVLAPRSVTTQKPSRILAI